MNKTILLFASLGFFISCKNSDSETKSKPTEVMDTISCSRPSEDPKFLLKANNASLAPNIDGDTNDICWKNNKWYPINNIWLGENYSREDFEGKFKLSWDENKLYLLVDIKDDILVDHYKKWDTLWWNDDCVEIFIDEDNGDDLHQFNHKAFAYHVALNCKDVVDLGADSLPHLYNDHIKAARKTVGNQSFWEFAIDIYGDNYVDGGKNTPVKMQKGKKMGFCLNYCDSDTSMFRENFISSIPVLGDDKDQGWKDAGVFNDLILE